MASFWTELLGSTVTFENAAGIRTRSIRAGSGEAVVLLHGIGATAETYVRNVVPLGSRYDVHAIDLLAHGLTGTVEGPLSRDAFVAHVIGYLDAVGIERAHLVGLSLGGWIATWCALLHPGRIASLINVVGSHLTVPVDEDAVRHAREGTERLKRLTKAFVDDPTRETLRARLGYVFHEPERQITDELVDVRWALHHRSTNGPQIAAFVGNPGADNLLTPERLAGIEQPTLFLWTEFNPSTPAITAHVASRSVRNSEFVVLPNCAHWPQWEDPQTFNERVARFIGGAVTSSVVPPA